MATGSAKYVNYLRFLHACDANDRLIKKKKKDSMALLPFLDAVCDVLLDFFYHNIKNASDREEIAEKLKTIDESWMTVINEVLSSLQIINKSFFRRFKRRTARTKEIEGSFKALARYTESTLALEHEVKPKRIVKGIARHQACVQALLKKH